MEVFSENSPQRWVDWACAKVGASGDGRTTWQQFEQMDSGWAPRRGMKSRKAGIGSAPDGMGSVERSTVVLRGESREEGLGLLSREARPSGAAPEAETKLGGGFAVAGEAEGTEVGEVALAATFGDRQDVVGVPERTAAGDGLHAIKR